MTADTTIIFTTGAYFGCSGDEPLVFHINGTETQSITLNPGWNWISTYLKPSTGTTDFNEVVVATEPWQEGDGFKTPALSKFNTFNEAKGVFTGTLDSLDYSQIYMV
jgi:hypothetical protein